MIEEQKAKDAEVTKAKEAKEAKQKSKAEDGDLSQAAVSKGALEGFKPIDENKLPSVTGVDGVKGAAPGRAFAGKVPLVGTQLLASLFL